MFSEDQLLPLSALQHWLYCPRQCALIHLEQAWAENKFTAEGQVLHHKAHEGADESKAGVRITRSMSVRSLALGISGQCDIVELHSDGRVGPVEYKRGKPTFDTAQAIAVMLEKHGIACDLMDGFNWDKWTTGKPTERLQLRRSCYARSGCEVRDFKEIESVAPQAGARIETRSMR